MHIVHKSLAFIFGAFLVVFTFITWAAAKWITFAIGILLILKAFTGDRCLLENKKSSKKK